MIYAAPHYWLSTEIRWSDSNATGNWRFELQRVGTGEFIAVSDEEPGVGGERLDLLTLIRGLEALDQPSRVTLLCPSNYVRRGLNRGLAKWRAADWHWESEGQRRPVKNADLWQRLDQIASIHQLDIRTLRVSDWQSESRVADGSLWSVANDVFEADSSDEWPETDDLLADANLADDDLADSNLEAEAIEDAVEEFDARQAGFMAASESGGDSRPSARGTMWETVCRKLQCLAGVVL